MSLPRSLFVTSCAAKTSTLVLAPLGVWKLKFLAPLPPSHSVSLCLSLSLSLSLSLALLLSLPLSLSLSLSLSPPSVPLSLSLSLSLLPLCLSLSLSLSLSLAPLRPRPPARGVEPPPERNARTNEVYGQSAFGGQGRQNPSKLLRTGLGPRSFLPSHLPLFYSLFNGAGDSGTYTWHWRSAILYKLGALATAAAAAVRPGERTKYTAAAVRPGLRHRHRASCIPANCTNPSGRAPSQCLA
jgi:hypothetical protein